MGRRLGNRFLKIACSRQRELRIKALRLESYVNNHMSVWGERWQGNDIVFVHVEM